MAPTGLLESFLGAIQASLTVLLVISYGAIAAKCKILDSKNTKAISKVSVRVFLPALLITKIGSQLEPQSASSYGVVVLWALFCHLVSFLLGLVAHYVFHMPNYVAVALMFNNTVSYPLLLVGALDETGILKSLVAGDESTSEAVDRAKAFFLVYSTISSCLTFAVGPRLIDEEAPEDEDGGPDDGDDGEPDEESALLNPTDAMQRINPISPSNSFLPTSLKPSEEYARAMAKRRVPLITARQWSRINPRVRWWLLFVGDFFNAPLLGAMAGAVIGLVPPLQRAFFGSTYEGGIFTAWLTSSLKNIGTLFVSLPVVVAGVSLYSAMQESRKDAHDKAARLPKTAVAFILLIRFVLWPVVSIATVYGLATRTNILGSDPMLGFTMMLMPTGPPATKLIALVQVSDGGKEQKHVIAKLLTLCYVVSPVLSFTVVGGLLASQASM